MDMENTTPLTQKQKQVLEYIFTCIKDKQLPPTIREIAEEFKFSSTGTVRDHLKALVTKGFIKIEEGKSRAIELVQTALFQIPVIGRVQAGAPILAVENLDGYLDLKEVIFPDKDVFGLKVKGDSMRNAGILEEDFVLVRKQEMASVGEIVIAMIGDEVTVKRLAKRDGSYFLDPANKNFQPIPVDENVSILGVVIHVVRKY